MGGHRGHPHFRERCRLSAENSERLGRLIRTFGVQGTADLLGVSVTTIVKVEDEGFAQPETIARVAKALLEVEA